MRYRITEIDNLNLPNAPLYVLVEFWRRDADVGLTPPDRINDFVFDVVRFGGRIVEDDAGRVQLKDGSFVNPASVIDPGDLQMANVERDMKDMVAKTICAYWANAERKRYPAKHVDARLSTLRGAVDTRDLKSPALLSELGVINQDAGAIGP